MKTLFTHIINKAVLVCTLLCLAWLHSTAQEQDYRAFHNISMGASTAANCFIQDTEGMIWAGSDKGLYAYDGYTALPYYKAGGFSNTHIYCAVRTDYSHFFLGSDNGLLIYNYRDGQYEERLPNSPKDIRCMARDGNKIWLGSLGGLYLYDITQQKISRFRTDRGLPHHTIYSIIKASDGKVYIGTYNG